MAASRNDLYCLFRNHHQGIFTHHEIKPLIKKFSFDTWLVVDLDDTVFEAACESELGGTRWYDFLYRLACELFPGDEFAASRIATKLDNAVKEHAPMKSVEEIMVIIIHTLQEMGIPVIGLTARDKSIHKLTERELNRIGVDFSRTKMMVQANTGDKHTDNLTERELNRIGVDFSQTQLKARSKTRIIYPFNASYDFEIPNQKGELYFYKGIIFCDENDKDICFKTFCKLNGYNPSHVCMVDDKRKHVDRMYKGISSNHCRVVGWHYTRVEYTRKPFDIQKALLKLDEMAPKLPAESLEVLETLKLR